MDFDPTAVQTARYNRTLEAAQRACAEEHERPPLSADRHHWRRLGELGVLGAPLPIGYGGGGLGAVDTALVIEALGRGCRHTGLVFAASAHVFACAMPIAEFASADTAKSLLPGLCDGGTIAANAITEAGAGSDVSSLATTARRVHGGWMIDGDKSWASNAPVADVLVVYATTGPDGYFAQTAFVVDTASSGVTVGSPLKKMGLHDCLAAPVSFRSCFVPDERVIGEPGQGATVFAYSMSWERTCLFAGYLGLAERLVHRVIEHVRSRRQFGAPLGSFQAVAHRVADMVLRTESARLLLYRACHLIDTGRPSVQATALSKLAASEGVVRTALDAVALLGALGYSDEGGVESAVRDSVPSTTFSGTSDIQRELIARELGL